MFPVRYHHRGVAARHFRGGSDGRSLAGSRGRRRVMRAQVGDRLRVHGRTVGQSDHLVEIVEVRGSDGGPPYLIRYDDGHEAVVFPGPDAVVETDPGPTPT